MKIVIAGLGIQGKKRKKLLEGQVVATVDPVSPEADYLSVEACLERVNFDALYVCTPDHAKFDLIHKMLEHKKHVLVEKPLMAAHASELEKLKSVADERGVTLYTAYNHRFEPHFIKVKEIIDSGVLGKIYWLKMFYGNGTARDIRNSVWRDQGASVVHDLGSHIFDTVLFWLGAAQVDLKPTQLNKFENKAYDHFTADGIWGETAVHFEGTYLSWRNSFYLDIIGEKGSLHMDCLCKWGESHLRLRDRKLPSGRPDEKHWTLPQGDPTWELEHKAFEKMCKSGNNNLANDVFINNIFQNMGFGQE